MKAGDAGCARPAGAGREPHSDHATPGSGPLFDATAVRRGTHLDITVFDMTGLALQDLTVGRLLRQRALATGAGTTIPWAW